MENISSLFFYAAMALMVVNGIVVLVETTPNHERTKRACLSFICFLLTAIFLKL